MLREDRYIERPIKGVIVFMDEHLKDKMKWISEWVREESKTVSNVRTPIKNFWN